MVLKEGFYMIVGQIKQGNLGNKLALSCVERQLLYILEANQVNSNILFVESYSSVETILDYFMNEDMKYVEFNIFNRLQHIASEKGIIDIEYVEVRDEDFINKYEYILLGADIEFLKKTYGSSVWSDEHYVLITQKDADTYYYLNDSPYDERIISKEEMHELSTSSAIGITLKRELIDEKDVLRQFCDKLNSDDSARRYQLKSVNENSLLQLRDALGIIRVMRRRNYYFISEYVDAGFMNEYLKGLVSKYIKLEYRRLRKTAIDMDFLNEFTSELIKDDIDITNKIKEKIGERIC